AGATQIVDSNFTTAINTNAGQGATRKRILFRSGQTFTSSSSANLTASGPGHLGTFGGAARAVIAGSTSKINFGSFASPSIVEDWRIVNLDFDGINTLGNTRGVQPTSAANRITVLNNVFRNLHVAMEFEVLFLDFVNTSSQLVPIWNQWAIIDNQFTNNATYAFLGALNSSAAMGNRVTGQSGQHAWRLGHGSRNVISNNELTGTPTGTALTIRGFAWELANRASGNQFTLPANSFSEFSIASDNRIISGVGALPYTYAASNGTELPRFRNHISERNIIVTSTPGLALTSVAGLSTIRNNLVLNTSTTDLRSIEIQPPVDPVINNFFVYNNSVFSGATTSSVGLCIVNTNFGPVPNLVARNNLGVAPGNTNGGTAPVCDFAGGGFTGSNNSTRAQIQGPSPLTTTPPTQPSHWQPQAATYPINGGFPPPSGPVPVFSDFFVAPRTGNHIGAVNP
ncbi:MAG: hypothetical protein Q8N51_12825, partial [Gammaproteobacteria bacterium]|nr:hypothetical protein [Gammaproteobacteria bacterium]